MSNPISIQLRNDLAEIERVHELLQRMEEQNDIPSSVVFAVTLSLDELLTNIISYGYEDNDEHVIEVAFTLNESELETVITDDGTEFNPLEKETPNLDVPLEQRKIGGLGIHLVRNFMDDLEYRRENGKNVFIMRKKRNPEQE